MLKNESTDRNTGLTTAEASNRLAKYGPNKLIEEHETRFLSILREELTEPMILLLITIGVLYGIINRDLTDGLTIISIVVILTIVEVWNEYRAKKSLSALRKLASPTTTVLRNGQVAVVPTAEVVTDDILLLKAGERVPADAQLLDSVNLELDESSLTGESLPVAKDPDTHLPKTARVTDQPNMIFAGTIVVKGRAKAVVTAIGVNTELGKVAGMTKAGKEPKTPLQVGMKQLSKSLIGIALFFSILIPILSYLKGLPATEAILYGLSLSFVTIPEEMPIIITMVLGIGAYSLAKKQIIVRRLRAAETLGNITVIATDKTGTITENKMQVQDLLINGKIISKQKLGLKETKALESAFLASDAIKEIDSSNPLSNPMSKAILEALKENEVDINRLQQTWVLKDELSFDSKRKLASYIYQNASELTLFSSGAPEILLTNSSAALIDGQEKLLSESIRRQVADSALEMARSGQRTLAFGYRRIAASQQTERQRLEQNFVFVGIIGFMDPPRKEVKGAIELCKDAGIKVLMITGDHPETAKAIAREVGIKNDKALTGYEIAKMSDEELQKQLKSTFIYARTTPEDKLRLVRLLRANGEIVAVTGDGVNDAPALKEAHIGIAMGVRGTDVAKETADMVLADDNFATIAIAVREGRKIFANLKKGVRYYLACKVALVSSFLLPIALGVPLPFAPIQIIVLELFMDLAASATFVAEPEEIGIMKRKPANPNEKFMNKPMLTTLFAGALSLFAAVSITYLFTWYQTQDLVLSQTMAFATWMIGHIFLALNFRSDKEPLAKLGLRSNKLMLVWALAIALTLLAATNLSVLHDALKVTSLDIVNWVTVLGVCFVAIFWMEAKKLLQNSASSDGFVAGI